MDRSEVVSVVESGGVQPRDDTGPRGTARPLGITEDSRGIIDPARMQQWVTLHRYPPGPELSGVIECFWAVSYRVPPGRVHTQQLITHPAVNLSVAHGQVQADARPRPLEATVTGVGRRLYARRIAGTGWGIAAKSTPGGFGAFVPASVAGLNDRVLPLSDVLALDDAALIAEIASVDEPEGIAILKGHLEKLFSDADPERRRRAEEVSGVSALARTDRSLRRLDHLAAAAGIGARTLQRLFIEYVGVSPTWVLRRYRLLEAAETVRDGRPVVWADVAADLGYSDQAHLVRDFRDTVGTTPAAYAAAQRRS